MSKVAEIAGKGKAKAMALVPTKEEMISGSRDLGAVALGIIASHAVLNIAKKQDSAVFNGVLAAGGLYGAMKVKNPFFKALCLGAGAYGALKLVGKATNAVSTPGATEGLAGMLPEGVKAALRKYIPTFSGVEEVSGAGNGTGDPSIDNLSLDDQGMDGNGNGTGEYEQENTSGMGDLNLAA